VIEQVYGNVGAGQARLKDAGPCLTRAERHAERRLVAGEPLGRDDVVARDDDASVDALLSERGGQRSDHVTQATGLDEVRALGRDEKNGTGSHRPAFILSFDACSVQKRPEPRMKKTIGIDSIGVFVPRLYVDLTGEWAQVRAPALSQGDVRKLVGKVTDGVGVTRMAIPDAHQDCATMAAMAAKRAIDAAQIDPRDIDYLAVGTETTVDQSKSTAAYVLGMLERHYGVSMAEAGAPQFQFACIGATYALEAAASRIRAGDNLKPYSLVIASDVSKYPLCTAGEYTQGAGAVALLLSENPRILALEHGLSATVTRDERDFFRPNWSGAAVVDGKYSVDVYLDCVESAFLAYASRLKAAPGGGASGVLDAIDHFLFHVPFPRMAEYAAARVFTTQWLRGAEGAGALDESGAGVLESLAEQVPPLRERREQSAGDARKWRRDLEREVAKSAIFRELYGQKVAPSLTLAQSVGNVYSGALYLSLAGLLERSRSRSLVGERAVFTSYGSGASAKVFSGIFQEGYAANARGSARRSRRRQPRAAVDDGIRTASRADGLRARWRREGRAKAARRVGSQLSRSGGPALGLDQACVAYPASRSVRAPAKRGICARSSRHPELGRAD